MGEVYEQAVERVNGELLRSLNRHRRATIALERVGRPAHRLFEASKRFKLVTSKSSAPIRFGRLIEQQPEWVWTAVEPLELGADLVVTPTIQRHRGA